MVPSLAWAISDLAAGVLGVAGAVKVVAPGRWDLVLAGLGVRRRIPVRLARAGARGVGAVECAVAAGVVLTGSRLAAVALCLAYLAVSTVAVVALRRGDVDCGCFGSRSAPVTGAHVAIDLAFAVAAAFAAGSPATIAARTGGGTVELALYLVVIGVGVSAVVGALTVGAELTAARRRLRAGRVGVA